MESFFLDFISGIIAGMTITFTGHPFDTIKVRMQRSLKISFLCSIKTCYYEEGCLGFFKGMTFPLCSVPLINAVIFAVQEISINLLGYNNQKVLGFHEGVICGSISGLANCIIVTPVELIKCRLQIQSENKKIAYYKGVSDCIGKSFNEKGLRSLYKGNVATILREIPAYAGQFGGYYSSRNFLSSWKKKDIEDLNNLDLLLCGGIGGFTCWLFSYPQDVIKTHLQTCNYFKSNFMDGGFTSCAKYIFNKNGIRGFWRGFLPCSQRAILGNGVLFVTYENSKKILSTFFDYNNSNPY